MISPTQWAQSRLQRRYAVIFAAAVLLWFLVDFRQSFQWQSTVGDAKHPAANSDKTTDNHYSNTNTNTNANNIHAEPPTPSASPAASPAASSGQSCESLQELGDDVFLILRTGANEAPRKLPAHFNTTLRCLPPGAYGIWSDLEEDIDGYHVGNALDEVNPEIVSTHPDYEYYRQLQQKGRDGFSAEELSAWATAPNSDAGRNTPGWKLDKWKFLPIAEKAYRRRPEAKWFIFMECDTYVDLGSLRQYLSKINPSKPWYLGNQMQIGDIVFAYGGSSFVLSNPAMKKLVEKNAADRASYDKFTGEHWAGDCVLGKVLKDAGVELNWAWPTFYGDSPFDMNYNATYGSDTARPYCHYAMTYHHLSPANIDEFYRLQQKQAKEHSSLLRHSDVLRYLLSTRVSAKVDNWDNVSSDEQEMKSSFDQCKDACQAQSDCVQFVFDGSTSKCKTSNTLKVGKRAELAERVTSGWMMDRVEVFLKDMDASCHGETWMLPK